MVNPKGYVPVLELNDGTRLTEGPAIVQYVADQVPDKNLVPPAHSLARYRLIEWLNFISTEVHKSFSPLFSPTTPTQTQEQAKQRVKQRLTWVDQQLKASGPWLLGEAFSVADIYLFVVGRWAPMLGLDVSDLAAVQAHTERMAERPATHRALSAED